MSTSLRLFLVRHGQVPANREFRFVGTTDERLSAEGELEADNLGAAFEGLAVDAVYSSPRCRTLSTARRIDAKPQIVADLAEQDFGEWEGLTRQEVEGLGEKHRRALERLLLDPEIAPPGGESSADLSRRVERFVESLRERGLRRVVLVSHVGPIKAILALALRLPADKARPLFLDTGSVSVVDWGERSLVRLLNCRGALGWQTARWMGSETQ